MSFRPRSDSHFLHFHPSGERAKGRKAGKGAGRARRGMLRGLIVSRAFERSDFTATVFSNDFPPLKASHPSSFSLSLLSSLPPSHPLPFLSYLEGRRPPPTANPAAMSSGEDPLEVEGVTGGRGRHALRIVRGSRGVVRQPPLMFLNYPRSLITGSFDVR